MKPICRSKNSPSCLLTPTFLAIGMSVISLIVLSFTCTAWADDPRRPRYSAGTNVKDLVAKGYRWVTVDGPYACATQNEVWQITSHRADLTELQMLQDGDGYYLIPGTLVQVIRDDHKGTRRLGLPPVGSSDLFALFAIYRSRYPGVDIRLVEHGGTWTYRHGHESIRWPLGGPVSEAARGAAVRHLR
jgi:hypothetical protein